VADQFFMIRFTPSQPFLFLLGGTADGESALIEKRSINDSITRAMKVPSSEQTSSALTLPADLDAMQIHRCRIISRSARVLSDYSGNNIRE